MKHMTLNEAIQEMQEHGYQLHKKSKLQEAIDCVKQYGYLVEDSDEELEDDGEGDFEDSDEKIDSGKDHNGSGDLKKELQELVAELRDIDGYADFVNHLKGLKGHQIQLLKMIIGNGKFAKNTQAKKGKIPVFKLHPTQSEIDIDNSLAFPLENKKGVGSKGIKEILESPASAITINNSPLLVYKHSDGNYYIIDGHHRWSQVALMNRKAQMNIILFTSVPEGNESPIDVLRDFQLVVKAQTGEVRVATVKEGNNIFKKSPNDLYKWVKEHTVQEAIDAWKTAKGHESDDLEAIAKQIMDNGKQMKTKNMPAEGAPSRAVMPQTDALTAKIAAKGMFDV